MQDSSIYKQIVLPAEYRDLVFVNENGEAATTSEVLAKAFDKNHETLLADIAEIAKSEDTVSVLGDDLSRTIKRVTYNDPRGNAKTIYELNDFGFHLVNTALFPAKSENEVRIEGINVHIVSTFIRAFCRLNKGLLELRHIESKLEMRYKTIGAAEWLYMTRQALEPYLDTLPPKSGLAKAIQAVAESESNMMDLHIEIIGEDDAMLNFKKGEGK